MSSKLEQAKELIKNKEYLDYFIMRKNEHISYLNNEYPSVRIMNVCGKIFACN